MSIIFWFQLKLAHPTKTWLPLQPFKVMAVYSVRLFMCHSKWDWNTYSPFSSLHILYSPYKKKKTPPFLKSQFRLCKSSLLSFTHSQLTPFHFVFLLPFQWFCFTIVLRHFICYCQPLWFLTGLPVKLELVVKNLPANVEDTGDSSLFHGSGRSPGVGNSTLL